MFLPILLLIGLLYQIPELLEPRGVEIQTLVVEKQQAFLAQCYKWQDPQRCDKVLEKARLQIVDDFTFRYGRRLYNGMFFGLRRVKLSLYNKINTNDLRDCQGSPIVRTREEMFELSGGDNYWLDHPSSYFCANPVDLLPAFTHELCHAFGSRVGHVAGYEECQSIGR